jgi:hypothetical protein
VPFLFLTFWAGAFEICPLSGGNLCPTLICTDSVYHAMHVSEIKQEVATKLSKGKRNKTLRFKANGSRRTMRNNLVFRFACHFKFSGSRTIDCAIIWQILLCRFLFHQNDTQFILLDYYGNQFTYKQTLTQRITGFVDFAHRPEF